MLTSIYLSDYLALSVLHLELPAAQALGYVQLVKGKPLCHLKVVGYENNTMNTVTVFVKSIIILYHVVDKKII